jgi:shikimate dehydrogenase
MAESGNSRDRYALVGFPVAHSRSPMIHGIFARQTGQALTYELIEASPEDFETAVRGFGAAGGKGMNVTLPHKEAAFALCSTLGVEAKAAGAVNTLTFENGSLHGDNTDSVGFIRDLTQNHSQNTTDRRVLVLGAGGATRGIIGPLLASHPAELLVANRTLSRAEVLKASRPDGGGLSVCSFDDLVDMPPFEVVINATSAGLKGEEPPFPSSVVNEDTFCYDLAYSLKPTPFERWAKASGAGWAVQGWGMLVEQAAQSFFIWRGQRPETTLLVKQLGR